MAFKKKSKSKSKFKYRPPSADTVKKRAEQSGGRFDSIFKSGFDVFKPQVGDNAIRFLPATWDDTEDTPIDISYPVWCHKFVGPDKSTYLCPRKMSGGPCAICDEAQESRDAGEEEEAKKLEVAKLYVAWIIDRKGDDDMPILYLISWTIDKDLAALRLGKQNKLLQIENPDVGYDVSFKRTGQGMKTRYSAWAIDREETAITDDEDLQQEILDYITEHPIPDVLNQHDNAYLEKVMSGTSSEKDEDDDDDDEKPRKRRGKDAEGEDEEIEADKKSARRKSKPADDDDDEPEDTDDDDDDDEEKPKKGVARQRLKPRHDEPDDDDDDDDNDDDDDDEEEKKPARKGKPKAKSADDDDEPEDSDDDDDDDENDDDEEEKKPARRTGKRR
jgi:hypothetical protein